MKTDGQDFLEALARFPVDTFESRFSNIAVKLDLCAHLDRNELKLLYEAALTANLCNLAINGWDTRSGEIRPENEPRRRELEEEFMVARDVLRASPGWQNLSGPEQEIIEWQFLQVFVRQERLTQ